MTRHDPQQGNIIDAQNGIKQALNDLWVGASERNVILTLRSALAALGGTWQPPPEPYSHKQQHQENKHE